MNPTLNERLKQIGRIFLYIVLVIFLIRNVLDVVRQVTASNNNPVTTQQTVTSTEVPDTAKSVAQVFLENWYSADSSSDGTKRLANLQPLITQSLYDYINAQNDFFISASQNPIQQTTSTSNSTGATNVPNTNNGQQPNNQTVSAKEVDVWQANWLDQKAGQVKVTARLVTSDDETIFFSVPVVKSGNTWQVSALPALVPAPRGSGKEDDDPGIDISDKKPQIQAVLDNFFPAWLSGNSVSIRLYMTSGKPIPSSNWLRTLHAQYEGVQDISPLSNNPLKLKVVIMIKDQNNVSMLLNYFITVEQKDGTWKIDSID